MHFSGVWNHVSESSFTRVVTLTARKQASKQAMMMNLYTYILSNITFASMKVNYRLAYKRRDVIRRNFPGYSITVLNRI